MLVLRDKWNEETIPEFINGNMTGDTLSSWIGNSLSVYPSVTNTSANAPFFDEVYESIASGIGDVINVAPIVSLEPIDYIKTRLTFVTRNDSDFREVENMKTNLRADLLADAINTDIANLKVSLPSSEEWPSGDREDTEREIFSTEGKGLDFSQINASNPDAAPSSSSAYNTVASVTTFDDERFYVFNKKEHSIKAFNIESGELCWETIIPSEQMTMLYEGIFYPYYALKNGVSWPVFSGCKNDRHYAAFYGSVDTDTTQIIVKFFTDGGEHVYLTSGSGESLILNAKNGSIVTKIDAVPNVPRVLYRENYANNMNLVPNISRNVFTYNDDIYFFMEGGIYKLGANSNLNKFYDGNVILNEGYESVDINRGKSNDSYAKCVIGDSSKREKCFKFIDGKLTFLESTVVDGEDVLYYVQYDLAAGDIKRRSLCTLTQCKKWTKDWSDNVSFFRSCVALSNDGAVLVTVGSCPFSFNGNGTLNSYYHKDNYAFYFDKNGNMKHVFFDNDFSLSGDIIPERDLGNLYYSNVVPVWDSQGNFEYFVASEYGYLTYIQAQAYKDKYGYQPITNNANGCYLQREIIIGKDGAELAYYHGLENGSTSYLTFAYLSPDKKKIYANYEGKATLIYNINNNNFAKGTYSCKGYISDNYIVAKNGAEWAVYQKNKSLDDLYSIALTKNLNNDSDSKVRDTVVLYDKNATINASMVSSGEKAFESDPFILALGSPGTSYVQSITSNVDEKGTPNMTFNSLSEIKAKIVSLFKDNSDANNFVKIDSASGGYIEKTYHNLEDGKEYYYEVEYGAGEKPGATQIFSKVNSHGAEPGDLIGGTYEVVKSIKEEFDNPTKVNSTFTIQSGMTISQGKLNFATGGYNILYIDVPAGYTGKLSFKANANVVRNETNGNSNSGTYPFADIYGEAYLSIKDRYGNLLDEWVDAAAIRTLNNESRHQVIEMLPEGRNYIEYRAYNLTANTIQFDYLQLDLVKANTPTTLGNQVIQNLKTSGSKGANVDKGTFAATHTIPNYILKEQRSGSYNVNTVPSVPLIQNIDGADYVLERVERGSFGNLFDVTYHTPYYNGPRTYGNTYNGKAYSVNVPQGYMGKLAFSYMGSATNYGRGCGSQTANYTISLVDPSKPARSNVVSSWSNSLPIAVQNTANSSYKLSSNTKYFSSSGYLVAGRYSLTSSIKLSFYNNGFKEVSGYGMTGKLDSDMYVLYLYRPANANDYAARNQALYKEIVEYKEFEGLLSTQYWNYYSSKTSTSVNGSPAISTGKYAGQRLNQYVLVYNSRTSGMDRYDMSFPAYNFFTQEEYRLNLSAGIKVVSAKGKLNISEHSLSSGAHTAVSGFGYYGTGDRNTLPWYGVSGEGRDRLQINGRDSFVDFGDKTYPYRAQAAWSNPLVTPWDNGTYPLLSHNCPTSAVWYKHIRDDKDVNLSNLRFTYTYSVNAYLNSGNYYVGDVDKNGTDNVLIPLASSDGNTTVRIPVNAGTTYIKNFKIYYMEKGKKIYVDDNLTLAKNYKTWTGNNASISVVNYQSVNDEPEDPALIYKKGEYVAQKVNYSDYEADSLKKGYWIYAHQAFNDGPHAKAGIVLNDDEQVIKVGGTSVAPGSLTIEQAAERLRSSGSSSYILTEPINRFYEDGKYHALYYAYDDTSRGVTPGGNPNYDKASNIAEIVFYIIGESSTAPYIKSIKTSPAVVIEDENAKILTEVGDAEGDTLSLTVELFRDSEQILRQKWTGLTPNAAGEYPIKTTNNFTCDAGAYTVIATVRDATGVGAGTYQFKVGEGGKIEGFVTHTEQWEKNRTAYNNAKFSRKYTTSISLSDYNRITGTKPHYTNVFWSGEKLLLKADTQGKVQSVKVKLYKWQNNKWIDTGITSTLTAGAKTGKVTPYTGSMYDSKFKTYGLNAPQGLKLEFTAYYSGSKTKVSEVEIIMDGTDPYQINTLKRYN